MILNPKRPKLGFVGEKFLGETKHGNAQTILSRAPAHQREGLSL